MTRSRLERRRSLSGTSGLVGLASLAACVALASLACGPRPGSVEDEAKLAGRTAESFPAADEDYFRDMDGGYRADARALTPSEVKGRNMWLVWTGGNDRFWDDLAAQTYGNFDLLKIVSSHPASYYGRHNRWYYLGLVNEPCFEKAQSPDERRFGLWLDQRRVGPDCPHDPFADARKYPGVEIGARGTSVPYADSETTLPVGSYYGDPSGIVGLRLFPNPAFDEDAAEAWDPVRYYEDPEYYLDKDLVRPYRVGMSCAFCHVGPSPTNPPPDPENPTWAQLNSNPGAQYFWVDRIFIWDTRPRYGGAPAPNERNFVYQLFHTNPPGALDTSLVSTDYINNPRTMNAVYSVGSRLGPALRWGREQLEGDELENTQFQEFEETQALADFWDPESGVVHTARVLKDGADSVGVLGALNRVYLNIGLFSEEWTLHFKPVVGGKMTSPIRIADARKNSSYWNATEQQTPYMALFFLASAEPDRLADAPGGAARLTDDEEILRRGKVAFANQCAACHSSKIPNEPPAVAGGECEGGGAGAQYLDCWNRYWEWAQSESFKAPMRELVLAPDFLEDNFLSSERRVPSDVLGTNVCSAVATNAIEGDIWDNFSSRTYKDLPSVGTVTVHHPLTGEERPFEMPAGGRGYIRPASLISLWSTAPYLQNNSVGRFEWSPSVEARLASFDDSIEKMLWPERRKSDAQVMRELGLPESRALDVPGMLYRTTAASCLTIPSGYLPDFLAELSGRGWLSRNLPWLFGEGGDVQIGPIPKGTPVNLLANLQLRLDPGQEGEAAHAKELLGLLLQLKRDLKEVGGGCSEEDLSDPAKMERAREIFLRSDLVDRMVELSKCPDYVVNRGHTFGAEMSDFDKRALIEFLKTM